MQNVINKAKNNKWITAKNKVSCRCKKRKTANVFNKYCLNIIDELRMQPANTKFIKLSLKEVFPIRFHEIINIPITESEIKCTIKILKNNNSSGYAEVSNKIIKVGCDYISKPLAHMFNMSLTKGIFPDGLKYSAIKPIYKNGDITDH
jgi:hypothetical protein